MNQYTRNDTIIDLCTKQNCPIDVSLEYLDSVTISDSDDSLHTRVLLARKRRNVYKVIICY
jgi:hypothetical protein